MTFDEALKSIGNMSFQQKKDLAVQTYQRLLPALKKYESSNDGAFLLCSIIGTAAAADGKLTLEESELASAILTSIGINVDKNKMFEFIGNYSTATMYRTVQHLNATLSPEQRNDLVFLIAVISAADQKIAREEMAYMTDLIMQGHQ